MKQFVLLVLATLSCAIVMAQSVIVVDSEKIFKSLPDYNQALAQVDALSKECQAEVDARFAVVSNLFNEYAAKKSSYSALQRKSAEAAILSLESEATALQESYFAKDGDIMKRRLALIAPIQERVFAAIDSYAKQVGADLVVDKSSNPSILYSSGGVDRTDAIINLLKKNR